MNLKAWLRAFRLRTLPLAIASIGMAGFLAAANMTFNLPVFILCIVTTVLLQILSNLANDYGDYTNGADLAGRVGPERAVQSGAIKPITMKRAIILFSLLAFLSGISLLYISDTFYSINTFGIFLLMGVLAIIASIKYTAGKNPYGYSGLGDISVLIFFGWVGVGGSYFLLTKSLPATILLPATSCGLLAMGVLNINNIRDIESDTAAGKRTIPSRIGKKKAVWYHGFLLSLAIFCAFVFILQNYRSGWQWLFVVSLPLFFYNFMQVYQKSGKALDPYLKQMALSTLLFVVSFGIGNLVASS